MLLQADVKDVISFYKLKDSLEGATDDEIVDLLVGKHSEDEIRDALNKYTFFKNQANDFCSKNKEANGRPEISNYLNKQIRFLLITKDIKNRTTTKPYEERTFGETYIDKMKGKGFIDAYDSEVLDILKYFKGTRGNLYRKTDLDKIAVYNAFSKEELVLILAGEGYESLWI